MFTRHLILGGALGICASGANSAPQYTVTLVPPPAPYVTANAVRTNDAMTAVFQLQDNGGKFAYELWDPNNGFSQILTPGSCTITSIAALSNHGVIVGVCSAGAFHSSPTKGALLISPLQGYKDVQPTSVNDSDVVIGNVLNSASGVQELFSWTPSGGMRIHNRPNGSSGSEINDNGEIIGNVYIPSGAGQAAVWTGSGLIKLGSPMNGFRTTAVGINDKEEAVVEAVDIEGNSFTYIWTSKWGFKSIDPFTSPNVAIGIDNAGEVLGYQPGFGTFYWAKKFGFLNVSSMLAPNSPGLSNMQIESLSEGGIASGSATDDDGTVDALFLVPTRNDLIDQ